MQVHAPLQCACTNIHPQLVCPLRLSPLSPLPLCSMNYVCPKCKVFCSNKTAWMYGRMVTSRETNGPVVRESRFSCSSSTGVLTHITHEYGVRDDDNYYRFTDGVPLPRLLPPRICSSLCPHSLSSSYGRLAANRGPCIAAPNAAYCHPHCWHCTALPWPATHSASSVGLPGSVQPPLPPSCVGPKSPTPPPPDLHFMLYADESSRVGEAKGVCSIRDCTPCQPCMHCTHSSIPRVEGASV